MNLYLLVEHLNLIAFLSEMNSNSINSVSNTEFNSAEAVKVVEMLKLCCDSCLKLTTFLNQSQINSTNSDYNDTEQLKVVEKLKLCCEIIDKNNKMIDIVINYLSIVDNNNKITNI